MTKQSKYQNNQEMLRGISAKLRFGAIQPNINGYVPHEKQVEFHNNSARTKLFIGGNRSGKTVAGATELVWWLTGKHPYRETPPPPVRMRAVAVDFLMGVDKIVKPEIAKWLPPSELKNGSWEDSYSKEFRTLTLENGSFVEFMCVDEQTEALTKRGWLRYNEITLDDDILTYNQYTNKTEWKRIKQLYVNQYSGKMVRFRPGNPKMTIDALITPNHKWITDRGLVETRNLCQRDRIKLVANCDEDPRPVYSDEYVAICGWIGGDGTLTRDGARIYQAHANYDKQVIIEDLIKRSGFDFYIYSNDIYKVYKLYGRFEKQLDITQLTAYQRKIYLEALLLADGTTESSGKWQFTNCDKSLVDLVMALGTLCGYRVTMSLRPCSAWGQQQVYCVMGRSKKSKGRSPDVQSFASSKEIYVDYTGIVWCPGTENQTFVARRNGTVYITGNSYDQDLDKFAGTSRHGVWFDEEPPESIYNENRMRLIDTGGSQWFTMTPVEGLCVDDQTQVLSKRGWLNYWEVETTDIILTYNRELKKTQWLPIEALYVNEDYEGRVLQNFSGKQIQYRCTVDHKWVTEAGELKPHPVGEKLIVSAPHENTAGLNMAVDLVELIGWVVGDGTLPKDSSTKVIIYQNEGSNSDTIRQCLVNLCCPYKQMVVDGRNRFLIMGDWGRRIRSVLGSKKDLPIDFITALNKEQLEALARGLVGSDGTVRKSGTLCITTIRKDHANAYAVVGTLLGYRVTINQYDYKYRSPCFKVNFWANSQNPTFNPQGAIYKGTVWCPHTRNGTFVAKRNGSIYITGNTWVYDAIYLAARTNPDIKVVQVDMTENPHIRHEEAALFLADLTEDERKARIHGRFISIGGLIYKGFDPAKHIIEPFVPHDNIDTNEKWLHVVGMDFGYNNPTAFLWAAVSRDGTIYIYDEHYASGIIAKRHAQIVHEKNGEHGTVPAYYVGDPSCKATDPITGTSIQLEYMEYGIPIVPGNRDVKAGINRVARYLEGVNGRPRLYITQNCTNLLREIARYRWGQWPNKKLKSDRNRKEEPHKKDDHACDALRYLLASRPEQDTGKFVPTLVPQPRGEYSDALTGEQYARVEGPSLQYDEMFGTEF